MPIPTVFISYSHDSVDHKKWILNLGTFLLDHGIDAILDQWDLQPGDDLTLYMEKNLRESDYIIMVCTDNYVKKANEGRGGVGYEKMIITSEYMNNISNNKVIPIIKQMGTSDVPTFLKTKLHINFSNKENFDFALDELIRTIHKRPIVVKPAIGNNPFREFNNKEETRIDGIDELITAMILEYERTNSQDINLDTKFFKEKFNVSNTYRDVIIMKAIQRKLINRGNHVGYLRVTHQTKSYAIEKGLIGKNFHGKK
ncbi:MAG: toll/interleukin-1 receptor domain-containing protein [Bacteroidota bacterium]